MLIFLIIKPTRCTNFWDLFLEWNSKYFGQFLCPSSGVFHCKHSNSICHTSSLTACEQAVSKPIWHIPLPFVQWKTPDDGQRNYPKHVEFHSKNKFEKLVHLVGSIVRNLTRCTVTWSSDLCLRNTAQPTQTITVTLSCPVRLISWSPVFKSPQLLAQIWQQDQPHKFAAKHSIKRKYLDCFVKGSCEQHLAISQK